MKIPLFAISLCSAAILTACAANQTEAPIDATVAPLYFSDTAPYEDVKRVKPQVVAECEIQKNIVEAIHEKSQENHLPLTDQKQARILSVEVVNATPGIFVFGNLGSVPATLDIKFTVTENNNTLLTESRHCQTNLAGILGLQPSACNKLEKCARNHGVYISERIVRRLYK